MQKSQPVITSHAPGTALVKQTTATGKPISDFTFKAWYYDHIIDKDTGEMIQKQWCHVGYRYLREYALKGRRFKSQLDCLLHHYNQVQHKCETVIFYDNKLPGKEAEIFFVHRGVIDKVRNKLRNYTISIPSFTIKKHFPNGIQS